MPCCLGKLGLPKIQKTKQLEHFRGAAYRHSPEDHGQFGRDRCGVACRVAVLADLADRTTLTAQLSDALEGVRRPRAVHDPGRVLTDLAVAVADARRRSRTSRCSVTNARESPGIGPSARQSRENGRGLRVLRVARSKGGRISDSGALWRVGAL